MERRPDFAEAGAGAPVRAEPVERHSGPPQSASRTPVSVTRLARQVQGAAWASSARKACSLPELCPVRLQPSSENVVCEAPHFVYLASLTMEGRNPNFSRCRPCFRSPPGRILACLKRSSPFHGKTIPVLHQPPPRRRCWPPGNKPCCRYRRQHFRRIGRVCGGFWASAAAKSIRFEVFRAHFLALTRLEKRWIL